MRQKDKAHESDLFKQRQCRASRHWYTHSCVAPLSGVPARLSSVSTEILRVQDLGQSATRKIFKYRPPQLLDVVIPQKVTLSGLVVQLELQSVILSAPERRKLKL